MRSLIFIFLGIIILCNTHMSLAQEKLEFVQVLVRHGDRENDLSYDPGNAGAGQLTQKGKEEMYDFGIYLRQRYQDLLKTEFDPSEVSFISSSKDRSINSASLIAYGLYKDFNLAATWSGEENVLYEQVPVRVIPTEFDSYLQMSRSCPLKDQNVETTVDLWMEEFSAKHPDFVATYERETGKESNVNDYSLLQEEVLYNISHGLPLRGKWLEQFRTNRDITRLKTGVQEMLIETTPIQRLWVGPMLDLFISSFESSSSSKRLRVYSGHDRFMFMLQASLGVWDQEVLLFPPPGSAVFMEATSRGAPPHSPQDLDLKFSYRNDTGQEPRPLDIPRCPSPCTLSMFKRSFMHLLNVDYDAECQL